MTLEVSTRPGVRAALLTLLNSSLVAAVLLVLVIGFTLAAPEFVSPQTTS